MNIAPTTVPSRTPSPTNAHADQKFGPWVGTYEATSECVSPYTRDYTSLRMSSELIGSAAGYASLTDAVSAIGQIVDGVEGATAAVQEVGGRFYGHQLYGRHYDNRHERADYSKPMTRFGGEDSVIGGDSDYLVHQEASRRNNVRAVVMGAHWTFEVQPG